MRDAERALLIDMRRMNDTTTPVVQEFGRLVIHLNEGCAPVVRQFQQAAVDLVKAWTYVRDSR